jgi:hypothetical protein
MYQVMALERCWMFAPAALESHGLMFLSQLRIMSAGVKMKQFTSFRQHHPALTAICHDA